MVLARMGLIVVLVAACGGQTATAVPTTQVTPDAPAATVRPTATSVSAPAAELPAPVAELEPGTYFKDGFEPRITFTVGDGWTAAQATSGFFDIQDEPGSLDVVAVQFGNVTEADTAAEAAANLADRPNLTVSEPEQVMIDGVPGLHLVIETKDPPDLQPVVFHPVVRLTPGDVSIATARRLDLNLIDVDGGVLAIMVGGSIAEWDHATEIAMPVIESVQIGD